MPAWSWTDPLPLAFVLIPAGLAALFVWGVWFAWRESGSSAAARRAALVAAVGVSAWMAAADLVARSGVLRQWERTPPPIALLLIAIVGLACAIAFGPVGGRFARHLPLWILVAVQAFRLPLELAMHGMFERGVMPVQMSYSGSNFDILTGVTALVVAPLVALGRAGQRLVAAWNVLGLLLLGNIVTIAMLSTPVVAWFGERQVNVWVTFPPFVWLPTMMVLAALAGHLVVLRALRIDVHRPAGER